MIERLELQNQGVNAMGIDHFTAAEKGDRTEVAWTAREWTDNATDKDIRLCNDSFCKAAGSVKQKRKQINENKYGRWPLGGIISDISIFKISRFQFFKISIFMF